MLEPIEEVIIDVDEEHSGVVVQKLSERKAEMIEMRPSGGGRLRLVFHAPTRGLIGYQGELLTDTRGTAIMNRLFHDYAPFKGEIAGRRNGVLISNEPGEAVAYALWNLEDRGPMMIEPGGKVYQGMIVGEHTRDNDLEVNVLKGKKLTNIRTTGKDEAVRLTPPIRMTLEKALAYIEDDELVEVTPKSIRLRKAILDPNDRKRDERAKRNAAAEPPQRGSRGCERSRRRRARSPVPHELQSGESAARAMYFAATWDILSGAVPGSRGSSASVEPRPQVCLQARAERSRDGTWQHHEGVVMRRSLVAVILPMLLFSTVAIGCEGTKVVFEDRFMDDLGGSGNDEHIQIAAASCRVRADPKDLSRGGSARR